MHNNPFHFSVFYHLHSRFYVTCTIRCIQYDLNESFMYFLFDAFVVLSISQLLLLATFTCWIDQKIENRKQEHLKTAWILLRSYPQTFASEVDGIFEVGVSNDATNQYRIQTRIIISYSNAVDDENHYVVSYRNVEAFRKTFKTMCFWNNRQITFFRQRIEVILCIYIYTCAHLFMHAFRLNVNCSNVCYCLGCDMNCST